MYLLLFYGPPSIGKYTVGRYICYRYGFNMIVNHKLINLARKKSKGSIDNFQKTYTEEKLEEIECYLKEDLDVLSTFGYTHGEELDNYFVNNVKLLSDKYSAKLYFFRFVCDIDDLFNRVDNIDRRSLGGTKINDVDTLKSFIEHRPNNILFPTIPFVPSLTINTSRITVDDASSLIISSLF